ncbi:unnamed protein product [Lactuca virosa]|uniref:Uncharacterized protein n=1 Tax=Lactuca virosa TaxID=75947 RepID=A0AAU9NJC2_9ASTR|nr:unnamed protein product [Lactuca virosa]
MEIPKNPVCSRAALYAIIEEDPAVPQFVYEALEHRLVVAEAAQRLRLPLISKDGEVHEEEIEKWSGFSSNYRNISPESAVGGVPNRFLGITPAYLWQTQWMYKDKLIKFRTYHIWFYMVLLLIFSSLFFFFKLIYHSGHKEDILNPNKKDLTKLPRNVPYVSSALFFTYNTALGPPYRVLVDTNFNLKSKIICRVVYTQLLAEQDTYELYAQITLVPEADQSDPTSLDKCIDDPSKASIHSFCKVLTASDTSIHGGFSVLRKHTNECLPTLDMSQPTPTQELVAKDLHGTDQPNWIHASEKGGVTPSVYSRKEPVAN